MTEFAKQRKYSVENVVKFLDVHLSDEEFQTVLNNCDDLDKLLFYLEINLYLVSNNLKTCASFPVDSILREITADNADAVCACLRIALELQGNEDELEKTIRYLLEFFETLGTQNSNSDNIIISNLKVFSIVLDMLIENDYNVIDKLQLFEKHLVKLLVAKKGIVVIKHIRIYVMPKYLQCSVSSPTSNILLQLWDHIVKSTDINLLCTFGNIFIKPQFSNSYEIINDLKFWTLIQDSLVISKSNVIQKQAIFLLKTSIDKLNDDRQIFNTDFDLVTWNPELSPTLYRKWKTFFVLFEISREKQLHLLKPTFKLIKNLEGLHPSWTTVIYRILLSHTQDVVVNLSVMHILSSNVYENDAEFEVIVSPLLNALNATFLYTSKYKEPLREQFTTFLKKLTMKQFNFLLNVSLTVSWGPMPLYYFYKFIRNSEIAIGGEFARAIIKQVEKLPHNNFRLASLYVIRDINFCENHELEIWNTVPYLIASKLNELQVDEDKTIFPTIDFQCHDIVTASALKNFTNNWVQNKEFSDTESVERAMLYLVHVQHLNHDYCLLEQNDFYLFITKSLLEPIANDLFGDQVVYALLPTLCTIISKENCAGLEHIVAFIKKHQLTENNFNNAQLLCKTVNLLIKWHPQSSVVQQIFANDIKTTYENPVQLFVALEILLCGLTYKILVIDDALMQSLRLYAEKFVNMCDTNIMQSFKPFLKLIQVRRDLLPCNQLLVIIRNGLETQNVSYIIADVLQVLKIATDQAAADDTTLTLQIQETINVCYKAMMEMKSTSSFACEIVRVFCNALYNVRLVSETCVEFTLGVQNKLVRLCDTMPLVAGVVAEELRFFLTKRCPVGVVAKFFSTVKDLLMFGYVLRKDQRVEFDTLISENWTFQHVNPYECIANTRSAAVRIVYELGQTLKLDAFVQLLMTQYKVYNRKRYFENSQLHFIKMRLMQAILLLEQFFDYKQPPIDALNFATEILMHESHQHSVRHMAQWFVTKILTNLDKTECDLYINDKFKSTDNCIQSITNLTVFIPVLYQVAIARENDETFANKSAQTLATLVMGPQFNVRLHAQYAYVNLIRNISSLRHLKTDLLYIATLDTLQNTQINDANIYIPIIYDNFHYKNHYNVYNIYCDLPRIYRMDRTEWFFYEKYFQSNSSTIATTFFSRNLQLFYTPECVKAIDVIDAESIFDEDVILQRKITPWMNELETAEIISERKTNDIIVVAALIDRPANLGGLSRTCEIFGVDRYVINSLQYAKDKEFQSLSMSSENWLNIVEVKVAKLAEFLVECKENGYTIVGAEQTSESVLLTEYTFDKKTVLVLGHEKEGIPPSLLHLMDTCVEIPQFGVVRSLNVHVAGALMIWEYTHQQLVT